MKYIQILTTALILGLLSIPTQAKQVKAVVTFYWPGEDGGRYDCNGNKLHDGVAAVDFSRIPQGSKLNLEGKNGSLVVVANDCGGSAVIACRAARERGFGKVPVIDVWAPNQRTARVMEVGLLGDQVGRGSVVCTINERDKPHKEAVFKKSEGGRPKFDFYAVTCVPYNSKNPVPAYVYNRRKASQYFASL